MTRCQVWQIPNELNSRGFEDTDVVTLTIDSGNGVHVHRSFDGVFSTPYAGRVRLSPAEALPHADDLLQWLTTLEGIPEQISQWPVSDIEVLRGFWAEIIGDDDLGDQLLEPLRSLRPDPNQVISYLRVYAENMLGRTSNVPRAVLEQLRDIIQKTPLPDLAISSEDIFAQIDVQAEAISHDRYVTVDVRPDIAQLPPLAKEWLGRLLSYLVGHPAQEAALRRRLRGYLWDHEDRLQHDHRHYLLFGQDKGGLAPFAWIEAAWNYLQHFRPNFGFFVTEAMLYTSDKITIVGDHNVSPGISKEVEDFLVNYIGKDIPPEERKVHFERLNARSATELKTILNQRVTESKRLQAEGKPQEAQAARFVGGDVSLK